MPPNGQPTQQLGESEQSVDCAYVNEYCLLQHKGNIRCETTFLKGRIIVAERAFKVGEVIFVEPPLRIVATKDGDDAWEKLSRLCRENEDIFPYDALWYWTALCSLTIEQLPVGSGIASVSEEVQRRLLLLYHPVDVCASEASCLLVEAFDLQVDAADMERLLQVWILNCFEHSDEPPAYVQYFLSAFMSHSCHPTAVWYNEGDDYVLRARRDICEKDEITVSYISEDYLLHSVQDRRKHLRESKQFRCECERCQVHADRSRGCICPRCSALLLPDPQHEGLCLPDCPRCKHSVTPSEVAAFEEAEQELFDLWSNLGQSTPLSVLLTAVENAEKRIARHFVLDKFHAKLSKAYERDGYFNLAEATIRKRLDFQKHAYPGLSITHAWTLESLGDALWRDHKRRKDAGTTTVAAMVERLNSNLLPLYGEALEILGSLFGDRHEYCMCITRKLENVRRDMAKIMAICHQSGCVVPAKRSHVWKPWTWRT
eukprot:TRINITY_DN31518_c0_g1_i3.p1 TRINITY_DN31518_c0_g1~~TRINITY_DN31518_c0_g1_i3.p1  ORF type:complete len:486 (+),score=61.80 TRINITY_DN31518_c0_g1_i3:63-1520(+)